MTDEEYVEAVLRRMADRLFAKVREEGRSVRTLTVKVRYNDRDENQRAESLREPTDLETDVYGRLRGLLREAWQRRVSLRMVSLKLSNVYDGVFRSELALETNARNHAARERLAAVLDELRRNKGWSVILRGHDFRLREAPRDTCSSRGNEAHLSRSRTERKLEPRSALAATFHCAFAAITPFSIRRFRPLPSSSCAKQHGLPAIALTDIGNLHGAVEFAQAAKRAGIKPIFGAELQRGRTSAVALRRIRARLSQFEPAALAQRGSDGDAEEGAVAAQQRRPIPIERLDGFTEGLIAVSPDLRLAELFPGRFYRMATKHLTRRSSPRPMRRASFPSSRVPRFTTPLPGDRLKYDIVQSIRTLTLLRQEHPDKRMDGRFHFRTPAEMAGGVQGTSRTGWRTRWKSPTAAILKCRSANRSFPRSCRRTVQRRASFCTSS